jgi:type II secretory pathway pseudopilin PulG
MIRHARTGTTLLEVMLFLGILSIIATTITAVFIATQDARVLQRSISSLEDAGTQLISTISKTTRRAEVVVSPSTSMTGSVLVLQMASNDEFPTMLARIGSGLVLVQKSETSALLSPNITISSVSFKNIAGGNVWFTFKLSTIVRTVKTRVYSRTFYGTATLFPDDQSDAGGCGSCPAPSCISHAYTWYVCAADVCTQSDVTLPC